MRVYSSRYQAEISRLFVSKFLSGLYYTDLPYTTLTVASRGKLCHSKSPFKILMAYVSEQALGLHSVGSVYFPYISYFSLIMGQK